MDSTAINRVTSALKKLLDDSLRASNGNAAETVFVGPPDDAASGSFKMLLYLYRLAANADLRSSRFDVVLRWKMRMMMKMCHAIGVTAPEDKQLDET